MVKGKQTVRIIRKKVGFIFNFDPAWMGGVMYMINLIKTLNYLDNIEKPEIFLFYRKDLKHFVESIDYPFLNKIEWKFPGFAKGYLLSWIRNRNVFIYELITKYPSLDCIFPLFDFPVKTNSSVKIISWYADLQHKYYPGFFTRRKLLERNARIRFIMRNATDLIISSKSVENDFDIFYPNRRQVKLHIYRFASVIDNLDHENFSTVKSKYNLPENYFIVSNQFHKHKNHKVVLEAVADLKDKGVIVYVVMTGKLPQASHSDYINDLYVLMQDYQLYDQILILGLISRDEQLLIMQNAQAVIQPSLFEGWSTVIEDAMSVKAPVIASNIEVNKEQLGTSGMYFNPKNAEELAKLMQKTKNINGCNFYEEHNERVVRAAKSFINILD